MTNLYLYKIGFYRLYGYPERYIFNFLGRKIGVLFIKESFLSYFYMFTDCSIYPIINFNSKFVYLCNKGSNSKFSKGKNGTVFTLCGVHYKTGTGSWKASIN